ncbi:MAG: threonylcarbamoyl-AMP synthase [Chloroflexi bacterium]|nr:threonylcarbamoyl-AMP synthase [Chloroflexota bacterium]
MFELERAALIQQSDGQHSGHQFSKQIDDAWRQLKVGGVLVLPTDTLYGLAADVFNENALRRVFAIKGRPEGLALPVLVGDWEMVSLVAANWSDSAQELAAKFWPGPLTLVLPRSPGLSSLITGGGDTVAVRSPNHRVPQSLISRLGRPITGTSANRSGGPDLLTLEDVRDDLGQSVDYIISCGPAPQGIQSTIVDVTGPEPRLIREGVIPFQEIIRASES